MYFKTFYVSFFLFCFVLRVVFDFHSEQINKNLNVSFLFLWCDRIGFQDSLVLQFFFFFFATNCVFNFQPNFCNCRSFMGWKQILGEWVFLVIFLKILWVDFHLWKSSKLKLFQILILLAYYCVMRSFWKYNRNYFLCLDFSCGTYYNRQTSH